MTTKNFIAVLVLIILYTIGCVVAGANYASSECSRLMDESFKAMSEINRTTRDDSLTLIGEIIGTIYTLTDDDAGVMIMVESSVGTSITIPKGLKKSPFYILQEGTGITSVIPQDGVELFMRGQSTGKYYILPGQWFTVKISPIREDAYDIDISGAGYPNIIGTKVIK